MSADMATMSELEVIRKLSKDIRTASKTLSNQEARYLVDTYYNLQDFRKATGNQIRALGESKEPNESIQFFYNQFNTLEKSIKSVLEVYVKQSDVGKWCLSITGIGPVITAGLMAHIDIEKAPTVGHIWSYAGLVPGQKWEKGCKRPWNAKLKVLCWKIGQSFVKVHNNESDVFGKIYKARKELEVQRNESGEYADQAAMILAGKKFNQQTDAFKHYSQGKLPPAHIQQRAERYATKLFLASFHEVAYFDKYKELPPKPYVIAQLNHAHYWGPPNSDLIPGLVEAQISQGGRENIATYFPEKLITC
jgi:hypothetical protein